MATVHRILCATDLSPASEAAWDEACRLGRLLDAEILLIHAVAPPPVDPIQAHLPAQLYQELVENARRDAQRGLDRLLAGVGSSGLKVGVRVEHGHPAQRILEVAVEEAADLLVVGTHGRTGLEGVWMGSVADRLVRQAPCPVLTVRPTPGSGPRGQIRRICYATDFSSTARAGWPWVVALAGPAHAEVDLVHVTFEPVADRHPSPEAIRRAAQIVREQGRVEVERFLEGSALPRERIHVHLPGGIAGEQIVHRAREQAADLVVMGTHGWSGVVRWILGSTARYVIQTAPCPVLTVAPASVSGQARRQSQGGGR